MAAKKSKNEKTDKNNFIVVGIDPSVRSTGVAVLRVQQDQPILIESFNIVTLKEDGQQFLATARRIDFIVKRIKSLSRKLERESIVYYCIESPSFGSRAGRIADLGGLFYALLVSMIGYEGRLFTISPSIVKKVTTGNGNASKELMIEAINRKFDLNFVKKDSDQADAVAIAYTGLLAINWYFDLGIINEINEDVVKLLPKVWS